MKTLLFAALILIFGLVVQADFTEFISLIGHGQCSESRFNQLEQEQTRCESEGTTIWITIWPNLYICSSMDIAMKCIDNTLSECWTPQELKKIKRA
jgi:hypothetical protein